ncbi:hypothetical protein ATANTOWER_029243 [Ataeniobius toweri]|uniref:Uncharacterized protein n=1 Tax=Ataeniobius toweri TaxID=208326 RepID=A0ABU7CD47_9TELE|nr:hypothetical protein [Ataeniobius toweri]
MQAVVLPSDSACRNSFSTGDFSATQFCFCGASERKAKRHQRTLFPSYPDGHWWKRKTCGKVGGFMRAVASWEVLCYPPSPF